MAVWDAAGSRLYNRKPNYHRVENRSWTVCNRCSTLSNFEIEFLIRVNRFAQFRIKTGFASVLDKKNGNLQFFFRGDLVC